MHMRFKFIYWKIANTEKNARFSEDSQNPMRKQIALVRVLEAEMSRIVASAPRLIYVSRHNLV